MNRDELLKLHDELSTAAVEVMKAKNQDYATYADIFRNFRQFGLFGVIVRMGDKLSRLRTFEERKEFAVKDESVRDTIVDLINYAVIFYAMVKESEPLEPRKPTPAEWVAMRQPFSSVPDSCKITRKEVEAIVNDSDCRIHNCPMEKYGDPDLGGTYPTRCRSCGI